MTRLTHEQLAAAVGELFDVRTALSADSDLSDYIKDSIDLGELIAVVQERYGASPQDVELFKTHSKLADVAKIFNHEI